MPMIEIIHEVPDSAAAIWSLISKPQEWPRLFADTSAVRQSPESAIIKCENNAGEHWQEEVIQNEKVRTLTSTLSGGHPHYEHLERRWQLEGTNQRQTKVIYTLDYRVKAAEKLKRLAAFFAPEPERQASEAMLAQLAKMVLEMHYTYRETAQTLLDAKNSAVVSVRPEDTIFDLCCALSEKRIGAVLVVDEQDHLVGLVSERDIVREIAVSKSATLEKRAQDIMTRELFVCEPDDDLMFVMACMTENKIRHLPVMAEGRLVGIVSIGDVVKQRMNSLQYESETMREYIAAREWNSHHAGNTGAMAENGLSAILDKHH